MYRTWDGLVWRNNECATAGEPTVDLNESIFKWWSTSPAVFFLARHIQKAYAPVSVDVSQRSTVCG